ncbi:hypothetical protein [Halorussus amylolyticus]|uniref:hypothetical protein n=1 Tax=Halorussus amylolyticus TaxID=1126242 RepID=UPI001048D338|nr:hypothetical protein [Halorussus amylolyticus]
MTRFDAATPEERRKLFADAIVAHRERASAFCTLEADADPSATTNRDGGESEDAETDAPTEAPPWVQFGDGTLNLDCTDAELDRLKDLLAEFPAFKIDTLTRPEEADGVNVKVSALADPNRVAQCIDRIFRDVYDRPEAFRAWVTAI